ncbi:Receptor-like protein kinase [Melia azedarach]|uniref:Receptor-like protein kinase n=1 Tax=Melia azedarach TaxID=155640 RepID=A0ACC1Y629_MELAZ|nr:Receptor-like protein kinase [Melia azedarach]
MAAEPLIFLWEPKDPTAKYHVYMYFAEVEKVQDNQLREFNISENDEILYEYFAPSYLFAASIYRIDPFSGAIIQFSLDRTEKSTLGPIISALEVYMVKDFLQSETNQEDVWAKIQISASSVSCQKEKKNNFVIPLVASACLTVSPVNCIGNLVEPYEKKRTRILGKGGFGTVYHGYLEDGTEVAVKMLSSSSGQGYKEFHAETKKAMTLSWEERVRMAMDAAQGLEYLHKGCKPPIVHRDIKSANILLNENLEAKLADFGLSKVFPVGGTHVSTVVAGTPGYLDPDQSVIDMISKGDIENTVDPSSGGEFDIDSAWKAVELALECASYTSSKRPNMSEVVAELKECLSMELSRKIKSRGNEPDHSGATISVNLDY